MPAFNIFMISIIFTSIIVVILAVKRLVFYNRKYHMPESRYTKLFHVLTKEHVAMFYIIAVIFHALFGIWFTLTL